ncbi:NUDIX hydrolase [Acidobacteriia bacterium AH_259_A11_L15]|nr:NUDIX hydrolase [Acidobacteriia bacterium AH_259_A11_L15]
MPHKTKKGARIQRSRMMFRGRVFRVRRDIVQEPALPPPTSRKAGLRRAGGGRRLRGRGKEQTVLREVIEHGGSVAVLAMFPDGRLLLVRQYRYPADDFLWELVAGHIDPGESPRAAARRELEEETGYRARRLERLVEFYPSPGFLGEKMIVFRARGLRAGRARPEPDEALEARAFTRRELEGMVRRGELRDGKTLVGLLLYWQRARR